MPAVKEMLAVAKRVLGYDLLQARSCLICHTAVHPGGTCELAVKQALHARRYNTLAIGRVCLPMVLTPAVSDVPHPHSSTVALATRDEAWS